MQNDLTIVMYHYVRNLKDSRYPNIKGLDLELFKKQIQNLKRYYHIITMEEVIESIEKKKVLPERSMLLTFDDGYIDHYTNVFPVLCENDIQGSFFMPGKILSEEKLLDVNKIHFILAIRDHKALIKEIFEKLDHYRGTYFAIEPNEVLYERLAVANRFDNKDVIFIKRLLQAELEEELRNRITKELFKESIPVSERAFSKELYMSYDQLKVMKKYGMHFGIHGYDHYWLGKLQPEEINRDIDKALDYYSDIIDSSRWTMCYPYGSYNGYLLDYIKKKGCKAGVTTEVRIANLSTDDPLLLPRMDTNDFLP